MSDKSPGDLVKCLRRRDYVVRRQLGSGACGETYLLHDDMIDEQFVCKKYAPDDQDQRERLFEYFKREIKLLHKTNHQNIVRIFNYYLYPEEYLGFILMEYIDGTDIQYYLKSYPNKVNLLFDQAVSAFEHLEKIHVLHRDIRPENLLVDKDGSLKIIDFGFGKPIQHPSDCGKSISTNQWSRAPHEAAIKTYDFATEVYYLGNLFKGLIDVHTIEGFLHADILDRMCDPSPTSRIETFSSVRRAMQKVDSSATTMTSRDKVAYKTFSENVVALVTRLSPDTTYVTNVHEVIQNLDAAHQAIMLEEFVPDCTRIMDCFILGDYKCYSSPPPTRGPRIRVEVVSDFLKLLRNASVKDKKTILMNLHSRLDAVPRSYTQYDDIPF